MTISATSRSTSAVTEQSNMHDVRSDRDHAPDEFAGMLAGAVNTPRQAPAPEKPRDGTSELDRPEDDEHAEASATKTKRTHAADSAAKTADPSATAVVQSVSALDPELQAKLARVMTRVRDETGHDVQVAETLRSQARQDALFAQGRETPGPVVTWTHNSKHTQGRAVDLVLDNGTAGLDAYSALQRIAGEEGLRTLGARDPGHLELPVTAGTAAGPTDATSLMPAEPADATGPGQVSIARLAQVAQVAEVAVAKSPDVARVATVAHVAAANDASRIMIPEAPGAPTNRAAAPTETQRAAAPAHAAANDAQNASRRFGGDSSDRESGSSDERRGGYGALAAAVALRDAPATHTAVHDVAASASMSPAERAARLIAAFEDAPARPLSQITMSVDTGNGTTDRIQVAMRGSSVNATIDAADARAAQSMTSRSDELARALSRDGIELEALRVRAAAGSNTAAPAAGSQSSSDTSTNSRFERGQAWPQQERQRSQNDRRDQQRDQRGGRQQ